MRKLFICFFTLTIALFSLATIVSANSEVPKDVTNQVNVDFEKYKVSLNNDKENFGLSKQEDALGSILGQGLPYYVVSKDYLNNNDTEMFSFAGYIFPIKVGSTSAGIVFAEQLDGLWKVSTIKNDLVLEQDIENSNGVLKNSNKSFLVYDDSFKIVAITDGKESYESLKASNTMSLKQNEVLTLKEVGEKIKSEHENNKQQANKSGVGGINTEASESKSISTLVLISIGCIAIALGFILVKIQKNRKNVQLITV